MNSLGYKMAWLATRDASVDQVATSLHLASLKPATWQEAVTAAYSKGWLLALTSRGWTVAAGTELPGPSVGNGHLFIDWLKGLSVDLGLLHYYCTHRVVDLHVWATVESGSVRRAYGYLGETGQVLFDIGDVTHAEIQLQEKEMTLLQDDLDPDDGVEQSWIPTEDTVLDLASIWSVDPRELEDEVDPAMIFLSTA